MLLDQKIVIPFNSKTVRYYESIGYEFPRRKYKNGEITIPVGSTILVNVKDLQEKSTKIVKVKCDYCNETFNKRYVDYNAEASQSFTKKDACKNCKGHKIVETNLIKYGVKSTAQRVEQKQFLSDLNRNDPNEVRKVFIEKGFTPLFEDGDYINSKTRLKYKCPKHPDEIRYVDYNNLRANRACAECGREKNMGENNWKWKGGITPFNKYLRQKLSRWFTDSKKACNKRCVITGKKFDVIHHLYAFELIMQETFRECDIDHRPSMNDYTREELDFLREKCLEIHYRYPLGVCLTNEVHYLFHSVYGRGETTPEMFEEFKQRYLTGEFVEQLKQPMPEDQYFSDLFEWGDYLELQKSQKKVISNAI